MPIESLKKSVEDEFGEPFLDVIKGFAADGHSICAVESILEISRGRLKRMLEREGIQIDFKKGQDSLFCKEARKESRGNLTERHISSLKRATESPNHNSHSLTYNGITDSMAGHARRLGLSYNTVCMRAKKSREPEYLFRPVETASGAKGKKGWRANGFSFGK